MGSVLPQALGRDQSVPQAGLSLSFFLCKCDTARINGHLMTGLKTMCLYSAEHKQEVNAQNGSCFPIICVAGDLHLPRVCPGHRSEVLDGDCLGSRGPEERGEGDSNQAWKLPSSQPLHRERRRRLSPLTTLEHTGLGEQGRQRWISGRLRLRPREMKAQGRLGLGSPSPHLQFRRLSSEASGQGHRGTPGSFRLFSGAAHTWEALPAPPSSPTCSSWCPRPGSPTSTLSPLPARSGSEARLGGLHYRL